VLLSDSNLAPMVRVDSHSMALKWWIVVCTVFVAAGWLLSAAGLLNADAYTVITSAVLTVLLVVMQRKPIRWKTALRRFRRPLPAAFGLTWLVAFVGGILHAPNNYDALTYRLPRVLAWLAAGHWRWIDTTSQRMNYSATNTEWISAPLLVMSHSDRLLFLLNLVPYTLLPGLIFAVYRRLGVRNRVAWAWMWVLPAALCFALQAASIGNDLIGAVFVLTSVYFSLEAWRSKNVSDVWLALLALALATGVKGSNLPLMLPVLVALWPVLRLLLQRRMASTWVLGIALLVSYLPTAILNRHFTGDWKGDPRNTEALQAGGPVAGILGNTIQLAVQSLQPPLLPGAGALDESLARRMPTSLERFLKREFPRFEPQLGELPQEEAAGLGLALVLLLGVGLCVRLLNPTTASMNSGTPKPAARLIPWAAFVATLAYMVMVGSDTSARLLSPYYLLLLPPLFTGQANVRWLRTGWWQSGALAVIALTILDLVLTPARPLWPAQTILAKLQSRGTHSTQLARAQEVYSVYRERNDVLHPLRDCLPPEATRIGVIADDNDSDYALWRPFGERTVNYLVGAHPWQQETRGFTWIVGKTSLLNPRYQSSLEQLRLSSGGQIVATKQITLKVSVGPEEWFVMRLPEESQLGARVAPVSDGDR